MRISSLKRLRFILTTVFLFGGKVYIERLRLLYLVPWRSRVHGFLHQRGSAEPLVLLQGQQKIVSPPVLRELLETLGPTFVKLGQILSLRPDFVGEELSRELSRLQSNVTPFPYEQVERIIVEELGGQPGQVFSVFDRRPIAAASLAQVHHAFLEDGTEVAVKVQRPGIRETIEQDIDILLYLARLTEKFIPETRPYNPVQVIREFADWTRRELDFAVEGHNAERFRYVFRDNRHIKIPVIHWPFTTPRVLTMEYVDGVRADDLAGIEQRGIDRKRLALHGVDAQLQQILIDGFFHADPHPGNSFALEGDVLCFYDFGMVGYLNENQRRELISCFVAFANRNMEVFLKHFLHLARVSAESEVTGFQKDASAILNEMFFSPTSPSIAWIFFRLINRGAERRIGFPADLALFSKALITTEAMGLTLYPDFDFNDHMAPFVRKAFEAYIDPARLRRSVANDFIDFAALVWDLPERIHTTLKRLEEREGAGVKLDPQALVIIQKELRRQTDRRVAEIALLAVAFLTAVMVFTRAKAVLSSYAVTGLALGFFLALFVFFLIRARRKE